MEPCEEICQQLLDECKEMFQFALSSGLAIPGKVLKMLEPICQPSGSSPQPSDEPTLPGPTVAQLGRAHEQLARLIQPATPGALVYLARQQQAKCYSWLRFLGPVPLVRGLVVVAAVSLVALLGISLIEGIDGTFNWGKESGLHLLEEELFLLAAAGIGASFSALFQVSRYITRRAYDPQYTTTYWIRVVLGFVSGMMLAMLIPIGGGSASALGMQAASDVGQSTSNLSQSIDISTITKPLLAMLGGFSVSAVYRVLNRLVHIVESLVAGETSTENEMVAQRRLLDAEKTEDRASLVARLSSLRRHGTPDEQSELVDGLDQLIDELSGEGTADSN